jgi:tight adherence protein C
VIASGLAFVAAVCAVAGIASLCGDRKPRSQGAARRLAAAVPARLRPPLDLAARIEAAGSPGNLDAGEVMAVKALTALLAAPLSAATASAAPGRLGALLLIAIPVAAFFAPDLYLRKRIRGRVQATRRELPGLLDLVRVAVDAGMAPTQALAAVGARSDALVAREFAATSSQIALGVSFASALDGMVGRLTAPELAAFAAALKRATTHGAPLSDTLAAGARDARLGRRRRIEEEAAKAAPKIQLVVALFLVPSVLLLVAAALASALVGGPLQH